MPMPAGRFRHRVVIQRIVSTQDPVTGEMITDWVTVEGCESVPSRIEPLSAREFIAAQAMQSKVSTKITFRYRPGLDAAMRMVHAAKNTIYNCHGFLADPKSGLEYLVAMCSDGVKEVP